MAAYAQSGSGKKKTTYNPVSGYRPKKIGKQLETRPKESLINDNPYLEEDLGYNVWEAQDKYKKRQEHGMYIGRERPPFSNMEGGGGPKASAAYNPVAGYNPDNKKKKQNTANRNRRI